MNNSSTINLLHASLTISLAVWLFYNTRNDIKLSSRLSDMEPSAQMMRTESDYEDMGPATRYVTPTVYTYDKDYLLFMTDKNVRSNNVLLRRIIAYYPIPTENMTWKDILDKREEERINRYAEIKIENRCGND